MNQSHVKLYALSTCGHCRNVKNFLNENGIEYSSVEVDLTTGEERQRIIDEVRALNPNTSFPTIVIGETVIVGFKEAAMREALGL
ncbi:MAG TPA: glutaredoxin family protein [Thermoleophilia bacterium]|nr:glutaredoxin family protein [Thermoleophilia bacterium]